MWPWEHAAAGYLLYTVYLRARGNGTPEGTAAIALGLGTQFPDLIDKTLAWYLAILPSGRSLAHSLFTAIFVSALVLAYARRHDRTSVGAAFVGGYLAHLFGDGLHPFLAGNWAFLSFLGWPLLASPVYPGEHGILAHLLRFQLSSYRLALSAMTLIALVLWRQHGYPGLGVLRSWFGLATPSTN